MNMCNSRIRRKGLGLEVLALRNNPHPITMSTICARAWEYFDHTSVHSVYSLACCRAWVSYRGEDPARW